MDMVINYIRTYAYPQGMELVLEKEGAGSVPFIGAIQYKGSMFSLYLCVDEHGESSFVVFPDEEMEQENEGVRLQTQTASKEDFEAVVEWVISMRA